MASLASQVLVEAWKGGLGIAGIAGLSSLAYYLVQRKKTLSNDGLYVFLSGSLEKLLPAASLKEIKEFSNKNVRLDRDTLLWQLSSSETQDVGAVRCKFTEMHKNKNISILFQQYLHEDLSYDNFVSIVTSMFDTLLTEKDITAKAAVTAELVTLRKVLLLPGTFEKINSRLSDHSPYLNILNVHGAHASCLHICFDNHSKEANEHITLESFICKFIISKHKISSFCL